MDKRGQAWKIFVVIVGAVLVLGVVPLVFVLENNVQMGSDSKN